MFQSSVRPSGKVTFKKVSPVGPGLWWHVKNRLRLGFLLGWLNVAFAKEFSRTTGIPTITSELAVKLFRRDGIVVDYGVVCYRVVTTAGVAALINDWYDGSKDISLFKYHGVGTGGTAEATADTALVTESTTALNPDNTRATGVQTKPTSTSLLSTATVTFDAATAITEHGLFDQAATGGGTLWDRSLFSVVNAASGDSFQAQYTCTINPGG